MNIQGLSAMHIRSITREMHWAVERFLNETDTGIRLYPGDLDRFPIARILHSARSGAALDDESSTAVSELCRELVRRGSPRPSVLALMRLIATTVGGSIASLTPRDAGTHQFPADRAAALLGYDLAAAAEAAVGPDTGAPSAGAGDAVALTETHSYMLRLVAKGLSNREIGDRLHYSKQAITHHLSQMMAQLDVANRAALVARAYELGLLGEQRHAS
jgi:DNA-binding NarL/FixJ family response regulator